MLRLLCNAQPRDRAELLKGSLFEGLCHWDVTNVEAFYVFTNFEQLNSLHYLLLLFVALFFVFCLCFICFLYGKRCSNRIVCEKPRCRV